MTRQRRPASRALPSSARRGGSANRRSRRPGLSCTGRVGHRAFAARARAAGSPSACAACGIDPRLRITGAGDLATRSEGWGANAAYQLVAYPAAGRGTRIRRAPPAWRWRCRRARAGGAKLAQQLADPQIYRGEIVAPLADASAPRRSPPADDRRAAPGRRGTPGATRRSARRSMTSGAAARPASRSRSCAASSVEARKVAAMPAPSSAATRSLHQRDQRRDHDGGAGQHQRRQLVAEGSLPPPVATSIARATASKQRLDRLALAGAERRAADADSELPPPRGAAGSMAVCTGRRRRTAGSLATPRVVMAAKAGGRDLREDKRRISGDLPAIGARPAR